MLRLQVHCRLVLLCRGFPFWFLLPLCFDFNHHSIDLFIITIRSQWPFLNGSSCPSYPWSPGNSLYSAVVFMACDVAVPMNYCPFPSEAHSVMSRECHRINKCYLFLYISVTEMPPRSQMCWSSCAFSSSQSPLTWEQRGLFQSCLINGLVMLFFGVHRNNYVRYWSWIPWVILGSFFNKRGTKVSKDHNRMKQQECRKEGLKSN